MIDTVTKFAEICGMIKNNTVTESSADYCASQLFGTAYLGGVYHRHCMKEGGGEYGSIAVKVANKARVSLFYTSGPLTRKKPVVSDLLAQ